MLCILQNTYLSFPNCNGTLNYQNYYFIFLFSPFFQCNLLSKIMIHKTILCKMFCPHELLQPLENKLTEVTDTLFRKSLSYLQAHPSFFGSNMLYSSAVMSQLFNSWMTTQSDKITIRDLYTAMINLVGCKGLKLSFTTSSALHCNTFAFKFGSEQKGCIVTEQIRSTLVCFHAFPPSCFAGFPFDSHQELHKNLKNTLN